MTIVQSSVISVLFATLLVLRSCVCEFSACSCDEIGLNVLSDDLIVCGTGNVTGECRFQSTYEIAKEFCESGCMRLCTREELGKDVVDQSTCNPEVFQVPRRTWTSDICSAPPTQKPHHYASSSNSDGIEEFGDVCVSDSESVFPLCCADKAIPPGAPTVDGECHLSVCNVAIEPALNSAPTDFCTIYIMDSNGQTIRTQPVTDFGTIALITDLPDGAQFCYSVSCTNSAGEGQRSDPPICDEFHVAPTEEERQEEEREEEMNNGGCPPEMLVDFGLVDTNGNSGQTHTNVDLKQNTFKDIKIIIRNESPEGTEVPLTLSIRRNYGVNVHSSKLNVHLSTGEDFPLQFDGSDEIAPQTSIQKTLEIRRNFPDVEYDFYLELELTSPCRLGSEIYSVSMSFQKDCPVAKMETPKEAWEVTTNKNSLPITVMNDNHAVEPWVMNGVTNALIERFQLQIKLTSSVNFKNVSDDMLIDSNGETVTILGQQDENGVSDDVNLDVSNLAGGNYDVRIQTLCTDVLSENSRVALSEVRSGARDDNKRPPSGDASEGDDENGNQTVEVPNVDLTWFWPFLILLGVLFLLVIIYHFWRRRHPKRQQLLLNDDGSSSVILTSHNQPPQQDSAVAQVS